MYLGLSSSSLAALGCDDVEHDGMQGSEWEDVDLNMIGPDMDRGGDDEDPESSIVYDLRDLATSKWKTRKYVDRRTWRLRRETLERNWAPLLGPLTDAYLGWLAKTSPLPCPTPPHNNAAPPNSSADTTPTDTLPTEASCTPNAHEVSIRVPYRRQYRASISDAFDIYLSIRRIADRRVAVFLKRDTPDYRVLNACPPCNYELEGEPELRFRRMMVVDGNNSLKRIKGIGSRHVSSTRSFEESDYYLSSEFVDKYAHEVKARTLPLAESEDATNNTEPTEDGDPTDGSSGADSLSTCTTNWKAAASDDKKKMWAIFEEAGIFASACRHGFILWVTDMIRSGELAKNPLAILARALATLGPKLLLGYDIGCEFEKTIHSSSLGALFKELDCRCCVNAFHGYSHNYLCQLTHHPNGIEGMGLEDLETLERVFSASNSLAPVTRYMTAYRRRVFIDLYFQHWDDDKYANLATMLYNNYKQALNIIEENTTQVNHVLALYNIDKAALVSLIAEERQYFQALGKRSEGDLHAIAYVELLEEYQVIMNQYKNASSVFHTQTPQDYQFIAPDHVYAHNLSTTRRADTSRRHLLERRDIILHDIIQIEDKMGIQCRWTPSMSEYQATRQYISECRYQEALEKLQSLVIKRLFELHKLNLSHTGYQMRTHIAKNLQMRSKAICMAVKTYNTVAVTVNRPTLDWVKVTHYSFLDEFNLLRENQNNIRERPWANPVIRETMRRYQRLQRAHEEVLRCNIEIRRLHTSIVDENNAFVHVLSTLDCVLTPLHYLVHEHITRCMAVNQKLLARIHQTYTLPGFTGIPLPGVRKGMTTSDQPESPSEARDNDISASDAHNNHDEAFDDDNGLDDETIEEVGGVIDYLTNLT
ncbi:hypothetical protein C0991_011015 [Blastosporella zonata]|nr:hypothetical protein C0991_011015 [Blastosporella zonata]